MTEQALLLDFGKITFHDKILIAEINEGVLLDVEKNRMLLKLGKNYFGNKPYGYISHRTHSYAVNPMVYLESAQAENLKAIAVVTLDPVVTQNTNVEKKFYKNVNAFNVFDNLNDAVSWLNEVV